MNESIFMLTEIGLLARAVLHVHIDCFNIEKQPTARDGNATAWATHHEVTGGVIPTQLDCGDRPGLSFDL